MFISYHAVQEKNTYDGVKKYALTEKNAYDEVKKYALTFCTVEASTMLMLWRILLKSYFQA